MKKLVLVLILVLNCYSLFCEKTNDFNFEDIKSIELNFDNFVTDFIAISFRAKRLSFDECKKVEECLNKYCTIENKKMIALYTIESKFNKYANSYKGEKYGRGLGQVSEIALIEYNRLTKSNYKPNDLYNIEINIKVSCWLINHYMTTYGFTEDESIQAYNIGCNALLKGKTAYKYLNKINAEYKKM